MCCKPRATPLNKNEVSLPMLELMSSELGSTLAERIIKPVKWSNSENPTEEDAKSIKIETKATNRVQGFAAFGILDWLSLLITRVSSFLRLVRVIAWILMLKKGFPTRSTVETILAIKINFLSAGEIAIAELFMLRFIQQKAFQEVYNALREEKSHDKPLRDLRMLRLSSQ